MAYKYESLPKVDYDSTFLCGRRDELGGAGIFKLPEHDHWRKLPDGTHTCSYCGSISEPEFFEILERYALGEPGYRFDTTTKSYKYYVNRPGVHNAAEGAIKFYTPHGTFDRDMDLKNELLNAARAKHTEELKRQFY